MSSYRIQKMDTATWLPCVEVTGAESITVNSYANHDDSSPLLQSCDMSISGRIEEGYYRISKLDAGRPVVIVATMLLIPDHSDYEYGSWTSSVSGKSVLTPAADAKFAPGTYVPMGTDAIRYAAELLASDIPSVVAYEGSFKLAEHVVFDLDSSHLDGVWQLLNIAGFVMSIAGDGTVSIHPRATKPDLTVNTANKGILACEISHALPIEDVPNVLRVYVNGEEFVTENDDPTSPTSTVTRSRRIDEVEEDPQMRDGESPVAYGIRRLRELSEIYETYDVTRLFIDGVGVNSLIRANLPKEGIEGDFIVLSQTIECEGDIFVSETWGRLA